MTQSADLIGQQIESYNITRFLDRGGMADVYLARHTGLQRDVVLKILLPSFVENSGFIERFQREAQAMARLQHPNIVQVYDTGRTPAGRPFIAMQYVEGGTLEKLLLGLEEKGQVMTVPFALALIRQVAAALSVAHAAGIVHRDLKPSNILLDKQNRPLLTDLGIAYVQDTQRLTRTDTFIGTPHYMSPEQGKGLALDARSDIYSLGVVLFEMLAGQRPFPGDSHWALIHQHVSVPAPTLSQARPGISRGVSQLAARCLEKDPARRYQTAAELVAALDQTLAAEGAAGSLTPSGEWQWRPRSTGQLYTERAGRLRTVIPGSGGRPLWRHPAILGLVALLVVGGGLWAALGGAALGGAALGGAFGGDPPPPPATPQPGATVLATVLVEVTSSLPTSTIGPTQDARPPTEEPAVVAPPTETPTSTETPESATETPDAADGEIAGRITTNVITRAGPGMVFPEAGTLARDTILPVLGDDRLGVWYLVQPPTGDPVWVSATFIRAEVGALGDVAPAATIPALPTRTPTPTWTPTPVAASPPGGGGGGGNPPGPGPGPTNTLAPDPTNTLAP